MAILGAHMSIAGGYAKAIERAETAGCNCLQIFTAAPQQWPHNPASTGPRPHALDRRQVQLFRQAFAASQLSHLLAHSTYLINLATPDEALWEKSIEALVVELQRADQLGIPYVVLHPGSYTSSSEPEGLQRIVTALNRVARRTKRLDCRCLLETTAGQGSNLGWQFEQLAAIREGLNDSDSAGICVDTCHVFAAGYPLASRRDYLATIRQLDRIVGLEHVKAIHLNDSKCPLGSRKDRHENIGEGELGLEPFRHLLNDRRFRKLPMYLETPKGERDGEDLDCRNLRVLRDLLERKPQSREAR